MTDDPPPAEAGDVKEFIDLLKKLLAALQKKRCYHSTIITKSAHETITVDGTADQIQAAIDAIEDKLQDIAAAKVEARAQKWCAKGKCPAQAGECKPEIDFTFVLSGHELALPAGGATLQATLNVVVTATGKVACFCDT